MNFKPIDLYKLKTISISDRRNKVRVDDFAKHPVPGTSFSDFISSLPRILAGKEFHELVDYVVQTAKAGRCIVIGIGGHVIKCGLTPVLTELIKHKVITAIAMNGAAAIHDIEIAMIGATSEDVSEGLKDGSFGTAEETALFFNEAAKLFSEALPFGSVLGKRIDITDQPYKEYSLLWQAYKFEVPVTVHIAIGTDIVHQHPSFDGAVIGDATHRDFRIFCSVLSNLEGGAYLNFGSAVILPEVFLKALNVARNLGYPIFNFVTANFDMIQHYRPRVNVVERPTQLGGRGYSFIGHHEIMIPLFAWAVLDGLASS